MFETVQVVREGFRKAAALIGHQRVLIFGLFPRGIDEVPYFSSPWTRNLAHEGLESVDVAQLVPSRAVYNFSLRRVVPSARVEHHVRPNPKKLARAFQFSSWVLHKGLQCKEM